MLGINGEYNKESFMQSLMLTYIYRLGRVFEKEDLL